MDDFERIINDACCDDRVKSGIPDLNDLNFCSVLQEYLIEYGFSPELVAEKTYKLFEKGNFPERQAYNKDGILVTFPSPEYKKKAIDKGTHFANDPKKANPNIFGDKSGNNSNGDVANSQPTDDQSSLPKTDPQQSDSDDSISTKHHLSKVDPDDTISVDDELKKSTGADSDTRTPIAKKADAEAVEDMLLGDEFDEEVPSNKITPIAPTTGTIYEVSDVISNYERYGLYGKGMDWYNSEGKLVGRQYYDEGSKKDLIKVIE